MIFVRRCSQPHLNTTGEVYFQIRNTIVKYLRIKKISMALAVILGSGVMKDAWADSATPANSNVDKQVELLSQQTAALQQQLQQLQQQIAALKSEKTAAPVATPVAATATTSTPATTSKAKPTTNANSKQAPAPGMAAPTAATTPQPRNATAIPYGGRGDLANIGGTAVITAPFIHSSRQFSGSDLIVNYSTIKKNVAILQQNKNFVDEMESMGLALPNFPLLELSGNVEALGQNINGFNNNNHSDLNLSNAELDMQARISTWVTGFMSFVYSSGSSGGGRRVDNSNVYLDNGFITIGNFDKSHFYGTVGQLYVPFGSFSTNDISNPFNKSLFRTKGRPIVLGYNSAASTGLDASIYGYRGDARTGSDQMPDNVNDQTSVLNQYGADVVYHFLLGGANIGFGASVINNVSDAGGMQYTDGNGGNVNMDDFSGFGESSETQVLKHGVPGADFRMDISYDPIVLLAEYTTATQDFNQVDLSYNGHGAKPSAGHYEADYKFNIFSRPSTFALSFDQSKEALGLNVPARGYTAAVSTSIFKNTLLTFEAHHYINYSSGDTASGNDGVVFTPDGGSSNGILAQLDAYF